MNYKIRLTKVTSFQNYHTFWEVFIKELDLSEMFV